MPSGGQQWPVVASLAPTLASQRQTGINRQKHKQTGKQRSTKRLNISLSSLLDIVRISVKIVIGIAARLTKDEFVFNFPSPGQYHPNEQNDPRTT